MLMTKAPSSTAPAIDDSVRETVAEILAGIELDGTDAVRAYSRRFDDWDPVDFRVEPDAIEAAADDLPVELCENIDFALEQVRSFASAQRTTMGDLRVETRPGVVLGHRLLPVDNVGAYVPGGRYPLIATAFMTIAVPKVAGVRKVTAVAPPSAAGGIDPATLYAMSASGADEIYCLGGVQAIAAMALGLGGISAVDMIVGPGNAFVAEAKRQLFGRVGIDLVAGPSEILVIADETASANTVALDLLAQAEHGPASRAVLLTWDGALADRVLRAVDAELAHLGTGRAAGEAWDGRGEIHLADTPEEALAFADGLAAEHVHVQGAPETLEFFREHLRNYGSLFLGETTTVVFGDKAIGTNHCLPTERGARYTSGLWVGSFLRALTYQEVTPEGARAVAEAAVGIASAEGMHGHAKSASLRNGAGPLPRSPAGAERPG
jgi:sulfopropanediol 3-dehydrogenase